MVKKLKFDLDDQRPGDRAPVFPPSSTANSAPPVELKVEVEKFTVALPCDYALRLNAIQAELLKSQAKTVKRGPLAASLLMRGIRVMEKELGLADDAES